MLLVAAALVMTGCDAETPSYERAEEVATAMSEADIECQGLETTTEISTTNAEHESLVKERGLCEVDGEAVVITMFANAEDREDWVAVGGLLGSVAVGPNWVVSSRSEPVVAEIAEALDASRAEGEESEEGS